MKRILCSVIILVLVTLHAARAGVIVSNATAISKSIAFLAGTNAIGVLSLEPSTVASFPLGPWTDTGIAVEGVYFPVDNRLEGAIIVQDESMQWQENESPVISASAWKSFMAGMGLGLAIYGFGWQMRIIRQVGRVSPEIP